MSMFRCLQRLCQTIRSGLSLYGICTGRLLQKVHYVVHFLLIFLFHHFYLCLMAAFRLLCQSSIVYVDIYVPEVVHNFFCLGLNPSFVIPVYVNVCMSIFMRMVMPVSDMPTPTEANHSVGRSCSSVFLVCGEDNIEMSIRF